MMVATLLFRQVALAVWQLLQKMKSMSPMLEIPEVSLRKKVKQKISQSIISLIFLQRSGEFKELEVLWKRAVSMELLQFQGP